MKGCLTTLGTLLVIGFVGWKLFYPTYSYRYRMTVEVDTPEGVKSGSSVVEVKTVQYPSWMTLGTNAESTSVKGEATVVDLGDGKLLFALLQTNTGLLAPRTFLEADLHTRPYPKDARELSGMVGHKAAVPTGYIPRMVTFADMADPTSVQLAYYIDINAQESTSSKNMKYEIVDNLEELFGAGVSLKAVTLEITSDEVTSGIIERLPWLPEYKNKLFDGRTTHTIKADNRLANSMGMGSFIVDTVK